MVMDRKPTGRTSSMAGGLTAGGCVSLTTTLAAVALLAKLVDMERVAWENVGYGIAAALLLSSYLGAITAYGKIRRQRLMVCTAAGAVYFGILLSVTALFFGGQYEAVGVTAALVFGGSTTAGLIGLREQKGRIKKIRFSNR